MYCENIITFFIVTIFLQLLRSQFLIDQIYIYIYMICSQHFYYNFTTNSMWQGIIDG